MLQRLRTKYALHEAVIKGCAVNLRHEKTGKLMRGGWKLLTSHARLAEVMQMPCRCRRDYEHGRITTSSSSPDVNVPYTPEMCKKLVQRAGYSVGASRVPGPDQVACAVRHGTYMYLRGNKTF